MKKYLSAIAAIILFAAALTACSSVPSDMLSEEEIEALRQKYPIYESMPSDNAAMVSLTQEEFFAYMDTSVYGTILSGPSSREILIEESPDIKEKQEKEGLPATKAKHLTYEVEVIQDAAGRYSKGNTIVISIPARDKEAIPTFQKGDSLVFIGSYSSNRENEIMFSPQGLYYVTEDGYAISSFSEELSTRVSGMKAEDCLNRLYDMAKKEAPNEEAFR